VWYVAKQFERAPVLTVAFLDIGQGDSIYIESPSGKQMLVDGGPDASVVRRLSDVMPFFDRSIDVVLATHPDKDHIGGLPAVLSRYRVAYVIDTGATSNTKTSQAYVEARDAEIVGTRAEPAQYVTAQRGIVVDFHDGAYARIVYPDADVTKVSDTNSGSIILQVVYGSTTVMLTGDAPQRVEKYVVMLDGKELHSTILKAGHHGSKTSSAPEFVNVVSPDYTIISAGAHNSYGHPHKEVMDLFASLHIPTLATYDLGTTVFESDGKKFILRD
jgi:competence protein ComEC